MSKFICCPSCNYQYLPGEIFNPKYFLGQPKNIIRNNIGEILGYEGIEMDTNETFVCEHCGNSFEIQAKISVNIKEPKEESTKVEAEKTPIQQLSLF